jgi:hypothetical protein
VRTNTRTTDEWRANKIEGVRGEWAVVTAAVGVSITETVEVVIGRFAKISKREANASSCGTATRLQNAHEANVPPATANSQNTSHKDQERNAERGALMP